MRCSKASTRRTFAFGGTLGPLTVDEGARVPLTFVPPFPVYPPETAWMRSHDRHPGLVLSERRAAGAWPSCPRTSTAGTREQLPDHAQPAGEPGALGRHGEEIPLDGRRAGAGRLSSLPPGTADTSPCQPDERGHVARTDRRVDRVGPFRITMPLPTRVAKPRRVCWSRKRRLRSPSPAVTRRSRFHQSLIMKSSCWSSRSRHGTCWPSSGDSVRRSGTLGVLGVRTAWHGPGDASPWPTRRRDGR